VRRGKAFILGNRLTQALHGQMDVINEDDDDDNNIYVYAVRKLILCF
jgi:hypothetical protein